MCTSRAKRLWLILWVANILPGARCRGVLRQIQYPLGFPRRGLLIVVVNNLDVLCLPVVKTKIKTVLLVDSNTVLPFAFALKASSWLPGGMRRSSSFFAMCSIVSLRLTIDSIAFRNTVALPEVNSRSVRRQAKEAIIPQVIMGGVIMPSRIFASSRRNLLLLLLISIN